MPHLVLPDPKYKQSFIAAVVEYQAEQLPNYVKLDLATLNEDFSAYTNKLKSESNGEGLPEGYVPHTVFWLVEGDEYLGRVDIRHALTSQLEKLGGHIGYDIRPSKRRQGLGKLALKLGLEKAKTLGLKQVLITCDVDNFGSNKIIQANGGMFQSTEESPDGETKKNRYWISVK